MPTFIPPTRPEDFNGSYGEEKVWDALASLDDKYTVFHSLRWVGNRATVGEADFVLLHPEKGLLVIEVKSGEIEFRNGEWFQRNYATGAAKKISPFAQAQRSMYELKYRIDEAELDFRTPMTCHCVWFPSVDVQRTADLPLESPSEIILDRCALDAPAEAIDSVFSYWSKKFGFVQRALEHSQFRRVINSLCPKFHAIPNLKTKAEETEQSYIYLTDRQAALLDYLEEQSSAVIHGPAGTGKTILAVEKARRIASRGERVLFLCFNIFLRDELRATVTDENITIHHAHSLSHELLHNEDTPVEKVLAEFIEYLEDAYDAESWPYKNVIVDEGQDLDTRLLNRLSELVKAKDGCFYVFFDKNQCVIKKEPPKWLDDAECRLVLHKNCRCTAEIFKSSCGAIGLDDIKANDVHGDVPTANFFTTDAEQDAIVASFIKKVTDGGLTPDKIAILTVGTTERSPISTDKRYAGLELSETRENGKAFFTSVRKFKGLEANAVLITDISLKGLDDLTHKRLFYVGASRARDLLMLAVKNDVPGTSAAKAKREIEKMLCVSVK